ncbi:MAG: xylulose kinase [Geodermatophilaceae bacterium]|nr:xylulose kinase [Geodermatophilaceae bacterium]
MSLVAGIDSSTQSCKVVVRDARSGALVRQGRAEHPGGTEVDPTAWWAAFESAARAAGGLDDVDALAVGGQQHAMICLDGEGTVVRPALLWNDTRSAGAAADLIDELGGASAWVDAVGLTPVASFTVTKLRWLAQHEPVNAQRTAAVVLPHDWLTWRLSGAPGIEAVTTDRGEASGTGYWSPMTGRYRRDLLTMALGKDVVLPRVLGPADSPGQLAGGALLGAGSGDNMAAALGLGAAPGTVVASVGTSGVVCAVSERAVTDHSGTVAGFADATGRFLPLVATLNASRVLDAAARMLGVDHARLSDLARSAPPGADGLVHIPYLEGERTPNLPDATGALHGMRVQNTTAANVARAAVEGLLCGLRVCLDALRAQGVSGEEVILIGGGARLAAVRVIAPTILGCPVSVPAPGEYVADGAARQAAWALSGAVDPPEWEAAGAERYCGDGLSWILERYAEAHKLVLHRREARSGA